MKNWKKNKIEQEAGNIGRRGKQTEPGPAVFG
jgi:hypothetical protein